jgi:S1-C subfamily serine protease
MRLIGGLLVLFAATRSPASSSSAIDAIASLKRSIVPVACFTAPNTNQVVGTGFLLNGRGEFLTARHVLGGVRELEVKQGCKLAIYVPIGGWNELNLTFSALEFYVGSCVESEGLDVAACKLNKNPFDDPQTKGNIQPVRFESALPVEGTTVLVSGFSLGKAVPISISAMVAGYATAGQLILDKTAQPGHSGSPAYLPSGNVVGMADSIAINEYAPQGLTNVVPSPEIVKFLKDNDIAVWASP